MRFKVRTISDEFGPLHLMTFEEESRTACGKKNRSRLPTGQRPNCWAYTAPFFCIFPWSTLSSLVPASVTLSPYLSFSLASLHTHTSSSCLPPPELPPSVICSPIAPFVPSVYSLVFFPLRGTFFIFQKHAWVDFPLFSEFAHRSSCCCKIGFWGAFFSLNVFKYSTTSCTVFTVWLRAVKLAVKGLDTPIPSLPWLLSTQ